MNHSLTQFRPTKQRMMWLSLIVLYLCSVFTGRFAFAQYDQGALNGIVTDASGAVIPNALVTLTNTDTNFSLQDKTGNQGEYFFSPIKIGNYSVSASAPGFQTTTQENVRVDITARVVVNLTLHPGAVQETVEVTSEPPLLQTESASVGQVMSTTDINNTPLNGRNWVYIAQLAAGVDPSFANGTPRGGGTGDFSANGQRTTQNNFMLDGVDNNVDVDDFQNGASYSVRPPPDALAEFKIDTGNYSAEFGHSAGAVLSASVKSGTNRVHGDAWEYVRNNALDTADWDSAGGVVPVYHENQFGATLGFPIWKDKVFYFADAEANRIAFAQPSPALTVPTASEVAGDFSEFFNYIGNPTGNVQTNTTHPVGVFAPNTGGQLPLTQSGGAFTNPAFANSSICTGGNASYQYQYCADNGTPTTNVLAPGEMDAVTHEVLADYPHPNAGGWTSANYNIPGSGLLYNNYNVNLPIHDNTWQWDQRIDYNISTKDQTYARYSYNHERTTFVDPLGPILDGGNDNTSTFHGVNNSNLAQNFMASETHLFTPSLINEVRFGYDLGKYTDLQGNANTPANVLVPGMGGVPSAGYPEPNGGLPYIRYNGTIKLSSAGARHDIPSVEHQNVYQILDNVTKTWKNHSFKFGMQLESIRTSFSQSQYPRGEYVYNGQFSGNYDYGGVPGTATPGTGLGAVDGLTDNMSSTGISPGWNTSYYRWYRAAYAQDDWKVNSKLTLNLGVRYDFIQPESSRPGAVANFRIVSQSLVTPGTGRDGQSATGTGIYEVPANIESQNVFAQSFVNLLAGDGVSIEYTANNPHSLVSVQHDNFAPRIGLSYELTPKTIIRTGFGIFYGSIEAPGGAELEQNYPWAFVASTFNNYLGKAACLPNSNAGFQNTASQCPSNGTADTANGSNFPYPITVETGESAYLANGGLAGLVAGTTQISMADTNPKTTYVEDYNLTVEREISTNLIASVGYVGNVGKHTYAGTTEYSPLAVTSANDPLSEQGTSAFPELYSNNGDEEWIGDTMYNSLQTKLEKRYSGGLNFLATYTWAHAEDDASNPGIGGGPGYRNTTLIPLKYEFTNSSYDVRHRVTINGTYALPFGLGSKYFNHGGAMDYLAGGWSMSATWSAQTGNPITISPGGNFVSANGFQQINSIRISNPFARGGTPDPRNASMAGQTCPTSVKNKTNWFNPCAFIDPPPGTDIPVGTFFTDLTNALEYSGAKSNQIYGPGYERVNMSMFKTIKTWGEQYVQLRADAFNLFNTQSWNSPSDTSDGPTGGQITSAETFQNYTPDARFFQLAAKYVF